MMSISSIGALPLVSQSSGLVDSSPISTLPEQLLQPIFGFLGRLDLQALAPVSKTIKRSVVSTAPYNEYNPIQRCLKQVIHRRSQESREFRDARVSIYYLTQGSITRPCSSNLKDVEIGLIHAKASLIELLTKLKEEELAELFRGIVLPSVMKDIITIAENRREIKKAYSIPDQLERGQALKHIIRNLADRGRPKSQAEAQMLFCERVLGTLNWDFALTLFREIGEALVDAETGYGVIPVLGLNGSAMKFARSITHEISHMFNRDEELKWTTHGKIAVAFAKVRKAEEAISAAMAIPQSFLGIKNEALRDVSFYLADYGDISGASRVARLISDRQLRDVAFYNISIELANRGNRFRANMVYLGTFLGIL